MCAGGLLMQVNRLAGLAVMLHCFLPGSWVPPLQTPSAMPEVQSTGRLPVELGSTCVANSPLLMFAVHAAACAYLQPVQKTNL
jgi:hypothetical protein